MHSFADYLEPLASFLPEHLISRHALAGIQAVCRDLPGGLAHRRFGFECPLGPSDLRAHVRLSAILAQTGSDALSCLNGNAEDFARWFGYPAWKQIHLFVEQWADPASLLHEGVGQVWLEFDVDVIRFHTLAPRIFFHLRTPIPRHSAAPQTEPTSAVALDLTLTAAELLIGRAISPGSRRMLMACFEALPIGARVCQVGMMRVHGVDTLRLCISGLTADSILAYLAAVRWSGRRDDLRAIVDALAANADAVDLVIDAGDAVHATIGLDCAMQSAMHSPREPNWPLLLATLVAQGLCTAEKRAALIAYPGYSAAHLEADWLGTRSHARPSGRGATNLLVRTLHRVTIVYQPGQPVHANAYPAAMYRWFPIDVAAIPTALPGPQ